MRKMYSEEQIKKKALNAINAEYDEDGKLNLHDPIVADEDIVVDGKVKVTSVSSLTDKEGNPLDFGEVTRQAIVDATGLVTPLTAPLKEELVGVDTANAQSRVGIGDGLEIDETSKLNVKGKVSVISAPTSTTLTDEQIAIIGEGVFINGSFLGYKNIILFPLQQGRYGFKSGMFIGTKDPTGQGLNSTYLGMYQINNKVISIVGTLIEIGERIASNFFGLTSLNQINGKAIPAYPTDTTKKYHLDFINGELVYTEYTD